MLKYPVEEKHFNKKKTQNIVFNFFFLFISNECNFNNLYTIVIMQKVI